MRRLTGDSTSIFVLVKGLDRADIEMSEYVGKVTSGDLLYTIDNGYKFPYRNQK